MAAGLGAQHRLVLFCLMAGKQGLKLGKQVMDIHRLDQHGVSVFHAIIVPVRIWHGEGGQHGYRRLVGSFLRSLHYFKAGAFALHTHVGDDHIIGMGANLGATLARRGSSFHLEAANLKHSLQGQQNGELVVYQQDPSLCHGSSPSSHLLLNSEFSRRMYQSAPPSKPIFARTYTKGMAGYAIQNFGCRASTADGDAIATQLEGGGLVPEPYESAKVVVVNTCAVTMQAERSARAFLRRVRRANPDARIVVTGCYAQRAPGELAALPGVAAVVGNSHKASAAQVALGMTQAMPSGFVPLAMLGEAPAQVMHMPFAGRWVAAEHEEAATLPLTGTGLRTRPILKVQDGCGNRCSFCVIPETRGPSRSVPLKQVLAAARSFAERGGQELVLSGINLGRWSRDHAHETSLSKLVRALLEQTPLPRLRLSSIEPMDWNDELLGLFAEHARGMHPRLAPHAHLPLQSGSDEILRRMHRRYRPWHYADKVRTIRKMLPEAAIGADVMVGFPGETEALFRESYEFIEALPLTYLHLFPFSPRPGTAAESTHRQAPVSGGVVKERMELLTQLAEQKRQAFEQQFDGKSLSAVVLRDGTAMTANFLHVNLLSSAALPDTTVTVKMITGAGSLLKAELCCVGNVSTLVLASQ